MHHHNDCSCEQWLRAWSFKLSNLAQHVFAWTPLPVLQSGGMLTQSQSLSDVTEFLKGLRAVFAKIGNDHLSSPTALLVCYD